MIGLLGSKMTNTRATETDNYETLIFTAGAMMHLSKEIDKLGAFEALQPSMTPEMRDILFTLISYRVAMDREKILGLVPVLQPYKRLHPIFYRLSQTEELYYTVEDTLLDMRLHKQTIPHEIENLLMRQREEINKQRGRVSKTKEKNAEFDTLKREYEVREAETKKLVYTDATLHNIEHRVLTNLTTMERKLLMNSPARDTIIAVFNTFNEHFSAGILRDKLESGITPVGEIIAPLYNWGMSMDGTLERVIHHTVDYRKEYAKLETLKKRIRANPHDKTSQRQYSELSQETGSSKPYQNLRTHFDEDTKIFDKVARRKTTDEEKQEAKTKLEEYMHKYASIVENTLPAVEEAATQSYEKTPIFLEKDDE